MRLERRLADPPSVVWHALTDREQLRVFPWFPCDVVVAGGRWEVGAAITFHFAPEVMEMTLSGEVITVDEPNELAFSWGDDVLRFELSAADGGTRLILTDELPPSTAARNAAGWDTCLDQLVGLSPSSEAWQPRFEVYVDGVRADPRPPGGPPEGYKGESD